MRRFQRVTVDEPSSEVTKDILQGIKETVILATKTLYNFKTV